MASFSSVVDSDARGLPCPCLCLDTLTPGKAKKDITAAQACAEAAER